MEKTKPVKINVPMTEDLWARLRRLAERKRVHGRASVSGVILTAIKEMLAREAAG
jgi:hypothetical protein